MSDLTLDIGAPDSDCKHAGEPHNVAAEDTTEVKQFEGDNAERVYKEEAVTSVTDDIRANEKRLKRFVAPPVVDEAADEISRLSMFVTQFFTEETLPKLSLPYGHIKGDGKELLMDMATVGPFTWSLNRWYKHVFYECLEYIRLKEKNNDEFEWYHDFIAFTNLQIAVYNNPGIIDDHEAMDTVMAYTAKHVLNLRSAVARNALLFVSRFVTVATVNLSVFKESSLYILPNLFQCLASAKTVYKQPAAENIMKICTSCACIDVAWRVMEYCMNRNIKISSMAAEALDILLHHISKEELSGVDLGTLASNVEPCLDSKSTAGKRAVVSFVKDVIAVVPEEQASEFWSQLKPTSRLATLIKPLVKSKTPIDVLDETLDQEKAMEEN